MEYFNSNADGDDRSKDDAVSTCLVLTYPCIDVSAVVSLEGRMFPVEVTYLKSACTDYCQAAVQTVFDIHLKVSDFVLPF
jgi:ATP-dependent RNA helicase DDX35